jgi:hypothetical protein
MGEHRNVGGGVTLLLAEKVRQFTCYWHTIDVMLGLQSRDHAKKRKENTSWSQATFVFFRGRIGVLLSDFREFWRTKADGLTACLVGLWSQLGLHWGRCLTRTGPKYVGS